jgi:signal transduction histidine kinase
MNTEPKEDRSEGSSSLISHFAASTALLAAAVVLLAVIFFQVMRGDLFMGAFKTPLEEWSAVVAGRIGEDPTIAQAVARNHQIGVVMLTPDGQFAFGPDGEATDPDELLRDSTHHRQIDVTGHSDHSYFFVLDKEQFTNDHNYLLAGLIALLLSTIGVVYAVQLSRLRPLKWLHSGVDAVSRGNFAKRVPVVRNDEIGRVARSFNLMTGRVQQMVDDRERLLADVSHELRSPLARIKVALELLPEGDKRDAISQDIREMESLTTALLEREQVRTQANQAETQTVNLVTVAGEVIDGFSNTPPGVELNVPPEPLKINGDAALIKVLMQNLVENALKFSLSDSAPVQVSLRHANDGVQIIIDDDGPGIPRDKAEKVFEPFVKLNPARGHRAGYGLGLNLCHRIVQAQGGSIEIQQRDKRGTRIIVNLPL